MQGTKFEIPPTVQFVCHTPNSVLASGRGVSVELTVDMLQVVLAFSTPSTIETVHSAMDTECDIEHFSKIVADLVARGLLLEVRETPSLIAMLVDRVDRRSLATALNAGALVVIPDAFPVDLAERVWHDLHNAPWSPREGEGYRYAATSLLSSDSPNLRLMHDAWRASKGDLSDLLGETFRVDSHASASWYRPGDYASPHSDSVTGMKAVGFNWYLAKEWRREWGGSLFWCPTGQRVVPRFNTVVLFRVNRASMHAVCTVEPSALHRRLAITGFWSFADSSRAAPPRAPSDLLVTPPIYGHDRPVVTL